MAVRWHRLLNVGLRQLFSGTCYDVQEEVDVSGQEQRLDFAVIRRADDSLPEPNADDLPDGLQDLRDHNVIGYKSMHEAFDRFALMELTSHVVTYSKLKGKADWRNFSKALGVFAVSTRKHSKGVVAELLQETDTEAVYLIESQGVKITCVVINQAVKSNQNWLWQLLQDDKSRWKTSSFTAIVNQVTNQLKQMGKLDPEDEAFENQLLMSWAEELNPDQLESLSAVQTLVEKGSENKALVIAKRMIAVGKPTKEIAELTELPFNTIEELRK